MKELIDLYNKKASLCNQQDCKDWWLAKAYALEQIIGKRPTSDTISNNIVKEE